MINIKKKQIANVKTSFKKLVIILAEMSGGRTIQNLRMDSCIIYDIPKDFIVFNNTKYRGRFITFFCGFVLEGAIISSNVFKGKNDR